jgi:acryloyl-coenzyme A reductase
MQAIVLRAFGSPGNLRPETVPDPEPGPGEVLLRVHACGVCYHDVINRRGNLPRTSVPAILGHEAAGEVIAVGPEVEGWAVGDRAATLQRLSCGQCGHCHAERNSLCKNDTRFFGEEIPGGYASYMAAPVAGLGRIPAGVSWPVAAVTCCTTGTAVHCLRTRGRLIPGETVLITGASGGVGVEALQEAGAHEVIVSPDLDFASEVRKRTGGQGVDLALEIVGSLTFAQTLKTLAPGGRLVTVGNLETGIVDLNPGLVIVKELEILGAYATTQAELQESLRLIETGALRSWVSDVLPLHEAAQAHDRLEKKEVAGRLVLAPVH